MNMKIVKLLFLGLMTIAMFSCKETEVPDPEQVIIRDTVFVEQELSPYVGFWSYSDIDMQNGTLELDGSPVGSFTGKGKDIVGRIAIAQNPNIYTTTVAFTAEISVFGQTQDLPVEERTSTGTWEEVDGKLKLIDDAGNDVNVVSSSESEIVFEGDFTEEITLPAGAVEANATVIFTVEK